MWPLALNCIWMLRDRLVGDRGQTAAEYLGILLVAALIIFMLATSGIGDDIANQIRSLVTSAGQGSDPQTVTN